MNKLDEEMYYSYQLKNKDRILPIRTNLKNIPIKNTKCNKFFKNNYLSSRNMIKSRSFRTIKVMQDFKNTIKETEELKNKIMKNQRDIATKNKKTNKDIRNQFKSPKTPTNKISNKFKDSISIINKEENLDISYDIVDSFNLNELINKDINLNIYNSNNNYSNKMFNKKNNEISNKQKRKIKLLKLENADLKNSNNKITKKNNELEKEILKYKNKEKYTIPDDIKSYNYYDQNLKKFIIGLKSSLQKNINENIKLTKNISDILKYIQSIYNNYFSKKNNFENLYNKINAQNQIVQNIEMFDYKKINNLKEEQNKLNKELEKSKINLNELKSKEKALSFKYESNLKTKQDNEELVLKLKKTINELNKGQLYINRISSNNNIGINQDITSDLYDIKLKQLNSIIKCIQNQKHILIQENYKLKNEVNNNKINNNKDVNKNNLNNINEKELKIKLDNLKLENFKNTKYMEKKNNQIKILKEVINKFSQVLKDNKTNGEIFRLEIERLTREDPEDKELDNYLKQNELDEEIKKETKINNMKLKEMDDTTKKYQNIINKKEQEISILENRLYTKEGITGILKTIEDKVKPLYKKSIIPRGKSFSYIRRDKDNDKDKKYQNNNKYNINNRSNKNLNNQFFNYIQENNFDINDNKKFDYFVKRIKENKLKRKNIHNNMKDINKYIQIENNNKTNDEYINKIYQNVLNKICNNNFEKIRCLKWKK